MKLKNACVLVVDDDPDVLTAMRLLLKNKVWEVVAEANPERISALLGQRRFDIILLDMNFRSSVQTGNEGLFWLRKIKGLTPQVPVIMITAYGGVDIAVRSLKEGASDFIVKPWQNEQLIKTLEEALEKKPSADKGKAVSGWEAAGIMLGQSEAMRDIYRMIAKIAPTDANILILGENGTGKDLVADAIHRQSARAGNVLVKVDIGALTESLFESELFGHRKGAFTDAREDRVGRFEAADGGTLFLDEIGNISLQQQAKLLHVLQNRAVSRIGENRPVPVDIRLICATNLPMSELSNESRFRRDLIYRINTVEITLPPLRRRGNDVLLLARHFLTLYAKKYFKPDLQWEASVEAKLKAYPFPGNVRELQYAMERAVIMSEGDTLRVTDLLFSPVEHIREPSPATPSHPFRLSEVEKETVLKAMEKHHGNISRAAQELGLTRTALYRRLRKYSGEEGLQE